MTQQEHVKLRTAIRSTIEELQGRGKLTTRGLTEIVLDRYADLVQEAADQLIHEAIAKWARSMMKTECLTLKSGQIAMPFEIGGLRLPQAISLPPTNGDVDALWTPLQEATFTELEAHCQYLQQTIEADTRRLRNLSVLRDFLAPHMADEHADEPIGPMLAHLAADAAA